MKNASKHGKQALATLFLFFGLLVSSFSAPPTTIATDCNCGTPNASVSEQTSTSVSFSWGAVAGATAYRVWYVRTGDNYTSQVTITGGTSATFSNLPKGTYRFYFVADCGGEASEAIIVDDLLMG